MRKFYIVMKGRQKGVYDSWADCQRSTDRTANAFKAYLNWQEVQDAVLFDMPDDGDYMVAVGYTRLHFRTYERFRDFILNRKF